MIDPDTMNLLKLGIGLGVFYMMFRQQGKDVTGVGIKQRNAEALAEKRRRNDIADEIEKLCPNKEGRRLAKKLRED